MTKHLILTEEQADALKLKLTDGRQRAIDDLAYVTDEYAVYPDRLAQEASIIQSGIDGFDSALRIVAEGMVEQEPVAYMAFAVNGSIRVWAEKDNLGAKEAAERNGLTLNPVFARPQPPVSQQDKIDAERYRWLRNKSLGFDQVGSFTPYVVIGQIMDTVDGGRLDARIDAARTRT